MLLEKERIRFSLPPIVFQEEFGVCGLIRSWWRYLSKCNRTGQKTGIHRAALNPYIKAYIQWGQAVH